MCALASQGGTTSRLDYRPRVADHELERHLRALGAVVIEGARGCGKTETGRRAAASEVRLDIDTQARETAQIDSSLLLEGARPRLLDEWQLVPPLWNLVRRAVDDAGGQAGQFILTGSAVPPDDATRHTGALRILRMRMRPMSLSETGHSSGAISLSQLFAGAEPRAVDSGAGLADIAERIAIGGWPALQDRTVDDALVALRGYLDETSRVDLKRLDGVRRDPVNVLRVLRSVGRNVATQASARAIARDVGGADQGIDVHTVLDYLSALARVFVIEDLQAWSAKLRSRTPLQSAPTRHFVDPSLAVAALDARPERLLADLNTLGFLFESLVVRDLRVYAQEMDATVSHFRDEKGLEADAIVERRDGTWAAFEVKLGGELVDVAAESLLKVAAQVDQDVKGPPAVLGVVTAFGYGYRRPDGVAVIPIWALAP